MVLQHTSSMKDSYDKELKTHEMESQQVTPLNTTKKRQGSVSSLKSYMKKRVSFKSTQSTKTIISTTSTSSSMHQSISRTKQSKNQIYKSTIW